MDSRLAYGFMGSSNSFFIFISNKKLFVWTLTNRFFGSAIFDYYASGKTLTNKVKNIVVLMIALMKKLSSFPYIFIIHPW